MLFKPGYLPMTHPPPFPLYWGISTGICNALVHAVNSDGYAVRFSAQHPCVNLGITTDMSLSLNLQSHRLVYLKKKKLRGLSLRANYTD
jgi:hypothetical protein